ncbi:MAG: sirohydrochlorin chelatase [Actinomycetota bacterium]|nr:sirohydrochlorin chelatase [Actinomycetota bacterium]
MNARPPLVLVAHGTRDVAGTALIGRLAAAVGRRLPGVVVRLAFVDVRQPTVADALTQMLDLAGPPAIVVPAFLAAGYHVREDLPRQVADAVPYGRAVLTPLLGPDPLLVAAAADRLARAGWRQGGVVVLGAAGSRDPRARVDLLAAADALARRLGTEVHAGYLASGEPKAAWLVAELRASGRRVAAASWLLAPGLFHRRLADSGADVIADPLGVHPAVVRAVVSRYREATLSCSSGRQVSAAS